MTFRASLLSIVVAMAPATAFPRAAELDATVTLRGGEPIAISAVTTPETTVRFARIAFVGAGLELAQYPTPVGATLALAVMAPPLDADQAQREIAARARVARSAGVAALLVLRPDRNSPWTAAAQDENDWPKLVATAGTNVLALLGSGDLASLLGRGPTVVDASGEARIAVFATPTPTPAPTASLPPFATPQPVSTRPQATETPTPIVSAVTLVAPPLATGTVAATSIESSSEMRRVPGDPLRLASETHLRNIRQLTFGGENAEAYWSPDGKSLILQSTRPPYDCDQIFVLNLATGTTRLLSSGLGRTTCAYYMASGLRAIYSSTHIHAPGCPPKPGHTAGYVWPLFEYDVFSVRLDGTGLVQLTDDPGYDAEATVSNDGSRIVFTSTRDGDLDIYTMSADGSDVRRVTTDLGYDGGAFFSPDGKKLVYRAHHPRGEPAVAHYKSLLAKRLVEPKTLEIMTIELDGGIPKEVTHNGAANFAPYWFPDGHRIIFASNLDDPKGRNFDLYAIGEDGTGLERVTFDDTFDGFPMFSPDGKRLVFASNRNSVIRGETNVFVADWVD